MRVENVLSLGSAIRATRLEQGITQAELATRANVSRQLVTDVERGRRPGVETERIFRILHALGKNITITNAPPAQSFEATLDDLLDEAT